MQLVVTAVIISTVALAHLCSAQLPCNGVVSGAITSDVTCTGDCVLDNAMITGNVVCSTGTLVAKGGSTISGNLLADGTVRRVKLDAVTISGVVQVLNANLLQEIVILQAASLTSSVNVDNTPGTLDVSGSINNIAMVNSGDLVADSLTTVGGITVNGGNGIIEICGSSIGGALSVQDHSGNIDIDTNIVNCDPTTITGGVLVLKGSNAVTIRGANLPSGDLIISENAGDVILGQLQVSDLKLQGNTGNLNADVLSTDSDVSITVQMGNIELNDLTIVGDTIVNNVNGMVTLTNSDFNLEDVSITKVTEDLTVKDNTDLNLTVQEVEGGVEITGNTINNANVSKNTGGVVINGNTIITILSCSDNTPAPTGSNTGPGIGDGQCATLLQ